MDLSYEMCTGGVLLGQGVLLGCYTGSDLKLLFTKRQLEYIYLRYDIFSDKLILIAYDVSIFRLTLYTSGYSLEVQNDSMQKQHPPTCSLHHSSS